MAYSKGRATAMPSSNEFGSAPVGSGTTKEQQWSQIAANITQSPRKSKEICIAELRPTDLPTTEKSSPYGL